MAARRNSRLVFHLLAIMLGSAALAACQPADPDTRFASYLDLLEEALSGTTSSGNARMFPPLPGVDNLQLGTDAPALAEIEKIDMLDLRGCELQAHLVRRNSTLGRYAKPSQRLFLELDYLRQSPPCIDALRKNGNIPLAETLERGRRARQHQLEALVFNATLGSHEFSAFWSAEPGLRSYPQVEHRVTVHALWGIDTYALHWLTDDYLTDRHEPELLLGEIAGGRGGTLLADLARQSDWLDAASRLLQQQLERDPTCADTSKISTRLIEEAQRYFIAELEPRLNNIQRHAKELLSPVISLERQLAAVQPGSYRAWRVSRDLALKEMHRAPSAHLALLSRLRQACISS